MKKATPFRLIPTVILISCTSLLFLSWGTLGHERINRLAVLQLPIRPGLFFYNHIDFMTQEATVPDLRKYTLTDRAEYPRHYADLENYRSRDSLPKNMKELHETYDERFLNQNGTLPWHLEELMQKLTRAFKEKRKTEILFLAADIGHYIGDAHMPLHTTINQDGQLTGQKGIHALWEAHLPELYADTYVYAYRQAKYIDTVRTAILDVLYQSHELARVLLTTDKNLRESFKNEEMYEWDKNGGIRLNKFNQPVHSLKYAEQLHEALHGMVETQLNKAIQTTADLWYTAWIDAGSPDLDNLDSPQLNKKNSSALKMEIKKFKTHKTEFPPAEREF